MADITPEERIEQINQELGREIQMWEVMGVMPEQVFQINLVKDDIWLQTLTKFLAEKDIIDEPEFIIFFKQRMLQILSEVRAEIAKQQAAARIHVPNKGMFN